MIWFIFSILFVLVGFIVVAIGHVSYEPSNGGDDREVKVRKWSIPFFVLGGLFLLLSVLRIVSVGSVGIPVTFGSAGAPMGPGVHLALPWTTVHKMNLREQQYVMVHQANEGNTNGDDSLSVTGADGGSAAVDSTLLFKIDPSQASNIYKRVGTGYVNQIIRPSARSCIGNGFATDGIVDAETDGRAAMQTLIHKCLDDKLGGYGILVDDFQLRGIHLPAETQQAVDNKVAANQKAQQKVFDTQAAEGDANIARVSAKATADSQQIVACGGRAVVTKNAAGQSVTAIIPNDSAHCNQAQLTPAFLQWSYIQALNAMAKSPNHSTIIVPTDQKLTPLINTAP